MKQILILIICLISSLTFALEPTWSDEFDGDQLDTTKWNPVGLQVERHHATNLAKQAIVKDGELTLWTTTVDGKHYTGMISTEGKFEAAYGTWEVRAKFGDKPGTWSDAWLYHRDIALIEDDVNKAGVEVDIFEHRSHNAYHLDINDIILYGLHWDGYGEKHKYIQSVASVKPGEFHVFKVKSTTEGFEFFIDGHSRGIMKPSTSKPMFMILSTEVRDKFWAGDIPKEGYAPTPTLVIDYVRYYKDETP